jgi:hypothetical protein
MNIINVSSRYTLDPSIVQYAHSIAMSFDLYGDKGPFCRDTLTDLLNRIPVMLVNEASMPQLPGIDFGVEPEDSVSIIIDPWGYYQHAYPITANDRIPVIALCPERIVNHCLGADGSLDAERYSILTAMVIIHEYAHAMMALPFGSIGVSYDNFYLWMEEAMANAFTLQCFLAHHRSRAHHQYYVPLNGHRITHITPSLGLDPIAVVTEFMIGQPVNYSLGLYLHEQGLGHYWLWSMTKETCNLRPNEKRAWVANALVESVSRKSGGQPNQPTAFVNSFYDVLGTTQQAVDADRVLHPIEEQMFRAVTRSDTQTIAALFGHNSTIVDCKDINGWTPLHHAVFAGHTEMTKLLISRGANVNAKAADGSTPLHVAVLGGGS